MKKVFGKFALLAAFALAASSISGAALLSNSTQTVQPKGDVINVGKLRHRHRHCHIVVTLGHAKKRCHTHRHNKIAHHGPIYH
ncbi:MAG: hypothetical protein AAGA53_00330 [Pseudomonadota bacterium]